MRVETLIDVASGSFNRKCSLSCCVFVLIGIGIYGRLLPNSSDSCDIISQPLICTTWKMYT